jgi:hypothetical protein
MRSWTKTFGRSAKTVTGRDNGASKKLKKAPSMLHYTPAVKMRESSITAGRIPRAKSGQSSISRRSCSFPDSAAISGPGHCDLEGTGHGRILETEKRQGEEEKKSSDVNAVVATSSANLLSWARRELRRHNCLLSEVISSFCSLFLPEFRAQDAAVASGWSSCVANFDPGRDP